jgi:hypothetical protein
VTEAIATRPVPRRRHLPPLLPQSLADNPPLPHYRAIRDCDNIVPANNSCVPISANTLVLSSTRHTEAKYSKHGRSLVVWRNVTGVKRQIRRCEICQRVHLIRGWGETQMCSGLFQACRGEARGRHGATAVIRGRRQGWAAPGRTHSRRCARRTHCLRGERAEPTTALI